MTGQPDRVRTMRVAVIGCGRIGGIYARAIRALGHEVVAVVDVDPDRARAVAGAALVYTSAEKMLADTKHIDAAGISTPPSLHTELVALCAQRGTPVLCEKPLALDLAGAERALDACAEAGVQLAIGFKMRFEPLFRRVHDVLAAGAIGRLRHVHVSHYQPMPQQTWARAEGVTMEVLSHAVDLCRWYFASEPSSVSSTLGTKLPEGGERTSRIRLAFGPDQDALIAGGWLPDYPAVGGRADHLLHAVGDEGFVLATRPGSLVIHTMQGEVSETVSGPDYDAPFVAEWAAFFDLLAGHDHSHLATEDDARAVQRILESVSHGSIPWEGHGES